MTTTEDQGQAAIEMPRYRSHNVVHALKLKRVEFGASDSVGLYPYDEAYGPIIQTAGWARARNVSEDDPGYYVVYQDGYASWSPTEAFEQGYTRMELDAENVGKWFPVPDDVLGAPPPEPVDPSSERMMKWFSFSHLADETARAVSARFFMLAQGVITDVCPGHERTVALRKLLEAKDAAVRATLHPGE